MTDKIVQALVMSFFQVLLGTLFVKGLLTVVTVTPDTALLFLMIPYAIVNVCILYWLDNT